MFYENESLGLFLMFLIIGLHLNLNLNTRRKLKLHKCVNSFCCRAIDVDKTLVVGELELLTRLFVYEG